MFLFYLAVGLLLAIGLHAVLKWFSASDPKRVKQAGRILLLVFGTVVVLVLLRFGLPYIAALLSALLGGGALLSRLMRWLPALRLFQAWRQHRQHRHRQGGRQQTQSRAANAAMSVEEARAVLGVGPDASREEIKKAYHRLMQKFHPDQGGTDYLASRLNQAKDVLLDTHKDSA